MTHKIDIEDTTYYIAHGPDALHFGRVKRGQTLNSGQPHLETFADEDAWRERVLELGGEFYEDDDDEDIQP